MKISASIYSDNKRSLKEIIRDLHAHKIDLLHVDCNDDPSVFEDIKEIRKICDLPVDLHLITSNPEKYFDLLIENPVEYITFQFENLTEALALPKNMQGKKGIAITTDTPVDVFKGFQNFDFILIMATTPGQSGGVFDKANFNKIRQFRKSFPSKNIHVDGGVNAEVSFILRNLGVSSCVSGSYLFNEASIGNAILNLTKREADSSYRVDDFMTPLVDCPVASLESHSCKEILEIVDRGNIGFCLVTDASGKLHGIVSSADIRKATLKNWDSIPAMQKSDLINEHPLVVDQNATVKALLQKIKASKFPVMYLPVINSNIEAVGIVNFTNLIKGES